ncbi:hypothetical protein AGDE_14241 [Angomonas deanei]|uniref:Uncharacterized protein n=1 Tax=Angomonas deanei TaxID=59799 RepID=A0A7G2C445_9TRYP|nr:hypothetical protein AGDE_14241 [Angomonas deanei]CAD2214295.1 hypothetical protein, conserved [Angomonas deanei]|eukprot:EPY21178.1 hypothetical protein AGDE_14241 [Angomonas deanei]
MLTDKNLFSSVTTAMREDLTTIEKALLEYDDTRTSIYLKLKERCEEKAAMSLREPLMSANGTFSSSSVDGVTNAFQANICSQLSISQITSAWLNFINSVQGSIWDAKGDAKPNFVGLRQWQQQPLLHRKLGPYFDGSTHSKVPVHKSSELRNNVRDSRIRLKGGEQLLLQRDGAEDDGQGEEEELRDPEDGDGSSSHVSLTVDNDLKTEEDAEDLPALLSLKCELPFMMHCWSATFTMRGTTAGVHFDEENTSYNQAVRRRPNSISLNQRVSVLTCLRYPSSPPVVVSE